MPVRSLFGALLLSFAVVGPAIAQLSLPGATAPAPAGSVVAPEVHKKPRPRVIAPIEAAPAESKLAGKTLFLNGGKSQIGFSPREKTADLSRLLLAGTKISKPAEECQVDVSGLPLPLTSNGKVGGLLRFSIPVPVCPLSFDVLDGAILVTGDAPACAFKEADCTVNPAGLWGPAPGEIGPDQVKVIERERTQSERRIRTAYQGLVKSTKDRAAIRSFASDQAGFSSKREESCRDYIGESRHGFCASRIAQARAAGLEQQLSEVKIEKDERKKRSGAR